MKVLFITQHETPNRADGRIFGGAQLCETQRIKLLSKYCDLYVHTPKESVAYENCTTINSSIGCYEGGDQKLSKLRNSEIISIIENGNFDAVLVNDYTNSTHVQVTDSSAKSVLIFHHNTPDFLGGISAFSKLEGVYKNYKKGGLTILPSFSCVEQWRHFIKKSVEKYPKYFTEPFNFLQDIEEIISFFIYPFISYEDFPISSENDGKAILITRIAEDKGVRKAFELAKNNNYDLKVFCPELKTEYQKKISDLYNKMFSGKIIVNAPRETIIEEISKSKFVINSRFGESFHIVSAEAAMCGVPVVAFGSKNFSPASIEANGMHESVIVYGQKDKIQIQNLSVENKQKVQNATKERYSEEECYKRIISYIDISKSIRNNKQNLEDFF